MLIQLSQRQEVRRLEREEDRPRRSRNDDQCGGLGEPPRDAPRARGSTCRGVAGERRRRPSLAGRQLLSALGRDLVAGEVGADACRGPSRRRGRRPARPPRSRRSRTRTPTPSEASCADRAVDLRPGAHVDTARRLDEDQKPRAALEPAAEQDLLLVAARERPDRLRRDRCASGCRARRASAGTHSPRPGGDEAARRARGGGHDGAHRFSATERHHERAFSLPVGREEADAGADRLRGAVAARLRCRRARACRCSSLRMPNAASATSRGTRADLPVERDDLAVPDRRGRDRRTPTPRRGAVEPEHRRSVGDGSERRADARCRRSPCRPWRRRASRRSKSATGPRAPTCRRAGRARGRRSRGTSSSRCVM